MCEKKLDGVKIAILTLGCKVNAYESDAMMSLLTAEGAVATDFEQVADVYIINTCSVTNIADRKSRQMLHRAKKENPDSVVIAAGCYIQALNETEREALGLDGIVGNNKKNKIVDVVLECLENRADRALVEEITDIAKEKQYEDLENNDKVSHTRAYIKIQDGCNQFCTYCIIPYTRGRIRSREPEKVLAETEHLVELGYKEIVLTGIHLSSYEGYGVKGGEALLKLMEEMAEIDGLERIRIGSLEPRVITKDFAERLSKNKKVCPHFHLSLQSGSDTVLKRMNRKYDSGDYELGCNELRKVYENPAITTDIIVGFPGETDEEFRETCEFAEKIGFSKIHVFKYSRRRGTVADRMPDQVREEVKNSRSRTLISIEESMGQAYACSFIGKEQKVLTEEEETIDGLKYLTGYTERYVRCAIPADGKVCGEFVTAVGKTVKDGILFFEI
ncbi:MAG: tRNA (N(6)-L-threonylcarbamoyladenosine(37)-C(2))-methylthiotransferase MtaB [Lachnospiraceae bacterium]|nr:tRNA (N(6)-L-threonylcarbamoyladenosine(37)-C(2))-methylthiotransferase MtaB [Lachnospiraceae bacterium]